MKIRQAKPALKKFKTDKEFEKPTAKKNKPPRGLKKLSER